MTAPAPARCRNALLAVSIWLGTVLCAGACDPTAGWSAPPATVTPASSTEAPSAAPAPAPTPVAAVVADPCHQGAVVYCVLNPAVSEATIRSTICVSGWTATVRPPTSYTEPLKLEQIAAEGLPGQVSAYEEDHRVPLELGGAPADPMNLSPEPRPASYSKDAAENAARWQVCAGSDLRAVQAGFVSRWLEPYPAYR